MAIVYKAFDPQRRIPVALKVLKREYLHDPQFRARFKREIDIHSNFRHEAIVPIYAYGQAEGQLYLVLGYMAGGSLEDRLRDGKQMSPREVVALLNRISPALDAAHKQGIIHRDLKPSNILYDEHGLAFISDFGIARLAEQASQLTGNIMIGSPAYMSPEQARGGITLNLRADLYSLGVMIYEMLTGTLPFFDPNPVRLALKQITAPIPDIMAANPKLPQGSREFILRALAKNPDDRFNTAADMTRSLAEIVSGERVSGRVVQASSAGQAPSSRAAPSTATPQPRPLKPAGAGPGSSEARPSPEKVPTPRPLKAPASMPHFPLTSPPVISQSSLPGFLRPFARYLRPPAWLRKPAVPYLTVPAPLRPILGIFGVPNSIALPKKMPGWLFILLIILVILAVLVAIAAAIYWLIVLRPSGSTSGVWISFALQH